MIGNGHFANTVFFKYIRTLKSYSLSKFPAGINYKEQYVRASLILFTCHGKFLQVESDALIQGYCTLLLNIETLKRMNEEAAHILIKEQRFDIEFLIKRRTS